MAELPLHALHATVLTLRSLTDEILRTVPREERLRVKARLYNELATAYWKGLPGQSRVPGQPPSATDLAVAQVMDVVHDYWPRPLRRLA